jgi:hypothetical protein
MSMHTVGAGLLEKVINSDRGGYQGGNMFSDGRAYEFMGFRDKEVMTVLGEIKVRRAYYYDREGKKGLCPKDKALDVEDTSFSPGIRRVMGRVGAYRPFGLGHEDIKEMVGIDVTGKEIERMSHKLGQQAESFLWGEAEVLLADNAVPTKTVPKMYVCMDGTGVPMVKSEVVDRQGKGEDGQAKTREAKLGCVFTQTTVDKEGRPVRDGLSTSYVGAIETAGEFGKRIYAEANRRGIDSANTVCVIGDGAPWIWNIAEEHFYGATQIIDLYHAREHYWNVAKAVFGNDKGKINKWAEKRRRELDNGEVEKVIRAIERLSLTTEYEKEVCEREIGYFRKNIKRMRYNDFRRRGLFVGSGVLEAGCRTVIGQRLKQSGMHWSVKGANNIIALRCCLFSNRWEDFWENRLCA